VLPIGTYDHSPGAAILGGENVSSKVTMSMTGLDTETLIQELMKVERIPLAKLESKQKQISDKRAAWNTIKSKIESLLQKMSPLTSKSAYEAKTAKISDPSVLSASVSDSAVAGSYHIEVTTLAKAPVLQSQLFQKDPNEALDISGELTLTVGSNDPISVQIKEGDSLNTIADKINQAGAGFGIKTSILQVKPGEHSVVITLESTGQTITVEEAFVGDSLGLEEVVESSKAKFKINGIEFERDSNTISDAIPGLTLDLSKLGEASVSVALNDDAIVNGLKGFIDEYNSLLDLIAKYNFWDNDTKTGGLLFGDPLLQRLLSEIRSSIFRSIGDSLPGFAFVGQIGISTGPLGASSRDGKLSLDESKFREALAADREGVIRLLSGEGDPESPDSSGILTKFQSTLQMYTSYNGFLPLRDAQFEAQNKDISRQMENLEQRLDMKLNRLQRQFTALEKCLMQMETQSLWLSQQVMAMFSFQ